MKIIGIATTGGDAPGINAALRASVRTAVNNGIKVLGFKRGYEGLLANDFDVLNARSVGGIIHLGGTILKTSRADLMKTKEGVQTAARTLKENCIDGMIVIGGGGSFRAACELHEISKIPFIGIPASIDNDLAGTDTTIGFDTAVNTAMEAIDKIRDTATSHERVFIVEVMGRDRGFLALEVGIAAGAELILIPEVEFDDNKVCERLKESRRRGKKSAIIVMAEGAGNCDHLAKAIEDNAGFEVRLTRLGHIQRGGSPTAYSRLLACKMGIASVEFLLNGKRCDMTAVQSDKIVPISLTYSFTTEKSIDTKLYDQTSILSI